MSVGSVPERGKHCAVGRTKTLTVDMCGQKIHFVSLIIVWLHFRVL